MIYRILNSFCVLLVFTGLLMADEPGFRTDASTDDKLSWYQIQPGVFPPAGSAHYFAGELIKVDHVNRKFVLRADRTDAQNRSHFDLPVGAQMLPFGAIYYCGAPASLADIPLGTHLHGEFYERDPESKEELLEGWHGRVSPEGKFSQCLKLEDDFSYYARQGQAWRIDAVNVAEQKLVATLVEGDKELDKGKTFKLPKSVRVWQGNGVIAASNLPAGALVQMNVTWATLYGPGRVTEIWSDAASQQMATDQQLEKHKLFIRHRGLPGWIDAVDNSGRVLTITFFGNVHPDLLADVKKDAFAQVCVAESNLRMYDPVNDRKGGPIVDVKTVYAAVGSSGVQAQIKPDLLLEGYRPKRIVRVFPSGWSIVALPKEEELFGVEE